MFSSELKKTAVEFYQTHRKKIYALVGVVNLPFWATYADMIYQTLADLGEIDDQLQRWKRQPIIVSRQYEIHKNVSQLDLTQRDYFSGASTMDTENGISTPSLLMLKLERLLKRLERLSGVELEEVKDYTSFLKDPWLKLKLLASGIVSVDSLKERFQLVHLYIHLTESTIHLTQARNLHSKEDSEHAIIQAQIAERIINHLVKDHKDVIKEQKQGAFIDALQSAIYNIQALILQSELRSESQDSSSSTRHKKVLAAFNKSIKQAIDVYCPFYTETLSYAQAVSNRAFYLNEIGLHEQALIDHLIAYHHAPTSTDILFGLAFGFFNVSQFEKAKLCYQKALLSEPDNPGILNYYAWLQYHTKEYDDALSELNHSIEVQPNQGAAYYYRALTHLAKGNYQLANKDAHSARVYYMNSPTKRDVLDELISTINDTWWGWSTHLPPSLEPFKPPILLPKADETLLINQQLVSLKDAFDKHNLPLKIDLRHASKQNILGRAWLNYSTSATQDCLVLPEVANALIEAHLALTKDHPDRLFVVYDGYRSNETTDDVFMEIWHPPASPSKEMIQYKEQYSPNLTTEELKELYFSGISSHSTGSAIDISFLPNKDDKHTEKELMGTAYGYLDHSSGLEAESPPAEERFSFLQFFKSFFKTEDEDNDTKDVLTQEHINNRKILREALSSHFKGTAKGEWWHFQYMPKEDEEYYAGRMFNCPMYRNNTPSSTSAAT